MAFLEDFSGEATTLSFFLATGVAVVGLWWWYKTRNHIPKVEVTNPPPTLPLTGIHMGVDDFTALQRKLRDEARADLATAHGEERKRLEDKIDALNARLADPDRALAEQQAIITSLEDQLARRGNQLGGDAITAAKAALEAGDFTKARALFETLAADTAPDVQVHAEASFALGQIAEQDIRWHDAASHFARAAKLTPTFTAPCKARELLWRTDQVEESLVFAEELVKFSNKNNDKTLLATALNNRGLSFRALKRLDEAEADYRRALEIGARTIGDGHKDFSIRLSNLANCLKDQGKLEEAAQMRGQAVELWKRNNSIDQIGLAVRLSNLGNSLIEIGKLPEAEAALRQAISIGRRTLPENHPSWA